MKQLIFKIFSIVSLIGVFVGAFTTYVYFTQFDRAKLWVSAYNDYVQVLDVSKYDCFGVNIYTMEEILTNYKNYSVYCLVGTACIAIICSCCILYVITNKKNESSNKANLNKKHINIIPKVLIALSVIGMNLGVYIFYTKYILLLTPEEKMNQSINYVYSSIAENEIAEQQNNFLFYFLISLVIISFIICIVSSIVIHTSKKKYTSQQEFQTQTNYTKLKELNELKNANLITEIEYEQKRNEIIQNI